MTDSTSEPAGPSPTAGRADATRAAWLQLLRLAAASVARALVEKAEAAGPTADRPHRPGGAPPPTRARPGRRRAGRARKQGM